MLTIVFTAISAVPYRDTYFILGTSVYITSCEKTQSLLLD